MRLESTVLTDLSANVFAALLLILLILLHAGGAPETSLTTPAIAPCACRLAGSPATKRTIRTALMPSTSGRTC